MIRNYIFAIDIDQTITNESVFTINTTHSSQEVLDKSIMECTVKPGVDILRNKDLNIILITGRAERCRKTTIEWLHKNDILYNQLVMVPDGYYDPDFSQDLYEAFKLKACIENKVHFVFDDNQNVLKFLKHYGFSVQKVNRRFDTAFKKLIKC
jgi:uncharacterized HAD superfamily protein